MRRLRLGEQRHHRREEATGGTDLTTVVLRTRRAVEATEQFERAVDQVHLHDARGRGSEQAGGELLAVDRRARVVGTHQLEDVDVLLACVVVGLHLIEQRRERGVVIVVGRGAEPSLRRHHRGCARTRGSGRAAPAPRRCRRGDQQLGEGDDHVLVARVRSPARSASESSSPAATATLDRGLLLGRQQRVDELLDDVLGVGTDEPVDDLAVLQRVHGRDRLHLERLARCPGSRRC